ncbi:hypothetical protein AKJ16_DCAP17632 [Drosera capensis]
MMKKTEMLEWFIRSDMHFLCRPSYPVTRENEDAVVLPTSQRADLSLSISVSKSVKVDFFDQNFWELRSKRRDT